MIQRALLLYLLPLSAPVLSVSAAESPSSGKIRFNRDIRPILSDNCFRCHGPDPASREAHLRLDQEQGLFAPREDGRPTVVKGKPDDSSLFQRLITTDADDLMPPPKSHKVLKPGQIELVQRWIAEGAQWEAHWSLVAPVKPAVPPAANPAWNLRNPIDNFIQARLRDKALAPSPEADRATLIRRLSLDLRGLPPSTKEVAAFLADSRPDAYERLVDEFLKSERYGEHRARYWLDAARYGDTHGIHNDNYREMWLYRDWVIQAFNQNMPFDRFTIEQLAGDLLPNRTQDQWIASGFNRCNVTTSEGGSIAEEVNWVYMKDRVETTSTVWMGLTAKCASCHDHKFDPLTMKDYYSLAAFFSRLTQNAMDGNVKDTPPVIVVPQGADKARWDQLDTEIASAKKALDEARRAARPEFDSWLTKATPEQIEQGAIAAMPTVHVAFSQAAGDQTQVCTAGICRLQSLPASMKWSEGPQGTHAVLISDAKSEFAIPQAANFDFNQAFSYGAWVLPPKGVGSGAILSHMDDAAKYRGWDLLVSGGKLAVHIINEFPNNALKVSTKKPALAAERWQHVFVTYNGSRRPEGIKIYVDGKPVEHQTNNNTLTATTQTDTPLRVGQRSRSSHFVGASISDARVYDRALTAEEVSALAELPALQDALAEAQHDGKSAKRRILLDHFTNRHFEPARSAVTRLAALAAEKDAIAKRSPVTHVMQQKTGMELAPTVLMRGEYDKPGDKTVPAVPAALPPLRSGLSHDRLGLAKWLVDPSHPLMARVTVNRFWQELFGTGLVRTSEDFGIMGESPSHPELLDWLAVVFRESGWDVKGFLKMLVTSATYRQAAVTTPEKLAADPENRLLSRGPRFRMDAEMLRDFALASADLLSPTLGGPSVKPYQPPGVWEAVAMFGSNTRFYKQDSGDALYRRSLYTFWKRSAPPASMDILNAPSREFCTVRRERTNTPLQALVVMNDSQFVEAARRIAELAIKAAGADESQRLDQVTGRLLSRSLSSRERTVALAAAHDFARHFASNPEAAGKLIHTGESQPDSRIAAADLAAWTMVANQIMNLDEALNK